MYYFAKAFVSVRIFQNALRAQIARERIASKRRKTAQQTELIDRGVETDFHFLRKCVVALHFHKYTRVG